jgi:hypothetical protein
LVLGLLGGVFDAATNDCGRLVCEPTAATLLDNIALRGFVWLCVAVLFTLGGAIALACRHPRPPSTERQEVVVPQLIASD